jgi:hypothetical protein
MNASNARKLTLEAIGNAEPQLKAHQLTTKKRKMRTLLMMKKKTRRRQLSSTSLNS